MLVLVVKVMSFSVTISAYLNSTDFLVVDVHDLISRTLSSRIQPPQPSSFEIQRVASFALSQIFATTACCCCS